MMSGKKNGLIWRQQQQQQQHRTYTSYVLLSARSLLIIYTRSTITKRKFLIISSGKWKTPVGPCWTLTSDQSQTWLLTSSSVVTSLFFTELEQDYTAVQDVGFLFFLSWRTGLQAPVPSRGPTFLIIKQAHGFFFWRALLTKNGCTGLFGVKHGYSLESCQNTHPKSHAIGQKQKLYLFLRYNDPGTPVKAYDLLCLLGCQPFLVIFAYE